MHIEDRLKKTYPTLTKREREISIGIAKGKGNREIAKDFGLQEQSVKNLTSQIMRKLGVKNRVQVALLARGIEPASD